MQLSGTDKAFIKEVIPKLPEPKPHYNSEHHCKNFVKKKVF
jgi:hypothetical protein